MPASRGANSLAMPAEKPSSPFTPGEPVPVELFVGRQKQIKEIRRYAQQACSGQMQSVFLSAERGMGKVLWHSFSGSCAPKSLICWASMCFSAV